MRRFVSSTRQALRKAMLSDNIFAAIAFFVSGVFGGLVLPVVLVIIGVVNIFVDFSSWATITILILGIVTCVLVFYGSTLLAFALPQTDRIEVASGRVWMLVSAITLVATILSFWTPGITDSVVSALSWLSLAGLLNLHILYGFESSEAFEFRYNYI